MCVCLCLCAEITLLYPSYHKVVYGTRYFHSVPLYVWVCLRVHTAVLGVGSRRRISFCRYRYIEVGCGSPSPPAPPSPPPLPTYISLFLPSSLSPSLPASLPPTVPLAFLSHETALVPNCASQFLSLHCIRLMITQFRFDHFNGKGSWSCSSFDHILFLMVPIHAPFKVHFKCMSSLLKITPLNSPQRAHSFFDILKLASMCCICSLILF